MDRQTVSIMQACALVGVTRRSIYNWLKAGKLDYKRTAGGSIRIYVDSLWRDPHRPHGTVDRAYRSSTTGDADPPRRLIRGRRTG
jgi:excisionase family DNA binding protein